MIDKNFQTGCVLIVGGSGGIGSLCAKEFAKAGAKVAITYYTNEQYIDNNHSLYCIYLLERLRMEQAYKFNAVSR